MDGDNENVSAKTIVVSTSFRDTKGKSHISIEEFLNFLKTAYQIQDSIEGVLMSGGLTDAVNWLKKKETQSLLTENSISCQTSEGALQVDKKESCKTTNKNVDAEPLKRKLSEVLSEGMLDSVLPYLIQNAVTTVKKPSSKMLVVTDKPSITRSSSSINICPTEKMVARRRSSDTCIKATIPKPSSEVDIHVCDEIKNMKKTFVCNQKLLTEKMGYFAEVTQGQRLEDMDISVHCDISIFEWLMQWVKKESLLEEDWPQLDPQCVIPILVSAAFLQMDPLLNDCLLYCHEHMNEILKTNTNLSCLNDSVLTRLSAMYTNTEIESIKDRKDKIQSRLFSKMIQSLAEPEPESVRGHWCSLATVFKCEKCLLIISPEVASKIPCIPPCMRFQPNGSIINLHVRDASWNISEYIIKLQKSIKTWRKVYWHLWGDVHFLFCLTCKRYFPANQIGWCRYHPDTPQFFTLDAQKAPLPIGRFPCCGERAYRFQLLEDFSGCQFRQHMVSTQDIRESSILTMLETFRHLIEEEPPQLLFPERLTRLVARDPNVSDKKFTCRESFWWDGFEIIPPRPKLGLLSNYANRGDDGGSDVSSGECTEEESTSSTSSSIGSDDEISAESNPAPLLENKKRKYKRRNESKLWQHNLSARTNQDIQRAYEEEVLKEMSAALNKCSVGDTRRGKMFQNICNPPGGIWVRLEAEWKESFNQNSQQKFKNIFSSTRPGRFRKF